LLESFWKEVAGRVNTFCFGVLIHVFGLGIAIGFVPNFAWGMQCVQRLCRMNRKGPTDLSRFIVNHRVEEEVHLEKTMAGVWS